MEEKKTGKPIAKKGSSESLLAIFFIFFILFLILLVVTLTVRSCAPIPEGEPPTETDPESESSTDDPDTPEPAVPVFTGGTVPAKPHTTAETKSIDLDIASQYAILVNVQTGEIIASKNGGERFAPASMTKVMTLIVACEHLSQEDMSRRLRLTQEVVDYVMGDAYQGTEISLFNLGNIEEHLNEEFLIQDLLIGIGMASASDCTYMIVRDISGSEEAFVDLMNQKVAELGLQNTHFSNAIGIENESNYTTAEDMAVIMAYAMQSDVIANILGRTATYAVKGYYIDPADGVEKTCKHYFNSTLNARLEAYNKYYTPSFQLNAAKLLGGKTGYWEYPNPDDPDNPIKHHCLVSYVSANADQTKYILVLGGSREYQQRIVKDLKDILDTYIK